MADGEFQTSVDEVFDFIKSNKTVSVKQVANAMSLPLIQVERLVKILEASKLIEVSYSLNETILTYKSGNGKTQVSVQPSGNRLQELESLADGSYRVLEFAKKDFMWRINAIESLLSKLEREKITPDEKQKLVSVLTKLVNEFEDFKKQVNLMEKEEKVMEQKLVLFKERITVATNEKKGVFSGLSAFFSNLFKKKKQDSPIEIKDEGILSTMKPQEKVAVSSALPVKKGSSGDVKNLQPAVKTQESAPVLKESHLKTVNEIGKKLDVLRKIGVKHQANRGKKVLRVFKGEKQ
ncbi:MAG: hypothetical protein ABH803_00120 [Candidatus Micrarchaeota archaeon]